MMIITSRLIEDARFYDKPILIFFTDDSCVDCEKIYTELQQRPIFSRYLSIKIDALEYLQYTVRLTRGIVPSITILNPDLNVLGLLESKDIKFIENKLREILNDYKNRKLKGIKIEEYVPEPIEPTETIIYDVINYILKGYETDSRMIEVYLTYSNIYKDYLKIKDKIKPSDELARYLLHKDTQVKLDKTYSANLAMLVNYDLAQVDELIGFIDLNSGEVYRSIKRKNKGLLLDEALVGSALLKAYERTFDEKYLNISTKIADYIINNLNHEKGFRDSKIVDEITKITYLEPISNAEASIFFAEMFNLTNYEKYKEFALKGLKSALGSNPENTKITSRVAIAYLKLFDSIKANTPIDVIDSRITILKNNNCDRGMLYYDGKCYSKIEDIKSKFF
ncbi:MAG: hypothetical protein QXW51_04310 [Sulfolobaceae archaeon]